jgi:hypothetical protein
MLLLKRVRRVFESLRSGHIKGETYPVYRDSIFNSQKKIFVMYSRAPVSTDSVSAV